MHGPENYRDRHADGVVEEAAEWFARVNDPAVDAGLRAAFADWLAASAEHVREYLQLAALHTDISELPGDTSTDELVRAFQSTPAGNIVPLVSQVPRKERVEGRKSSYPGFLAVAASLVIAAVALFLWQQSATVVYRTATGEQKSFPLPDGSLVTLNAVSELRLSFSDDTRDLELVSGEAFFDVAKNPQRPFRVLTGDTVIRALGTTFNVYHRHDTVSVTVVEGLVEVNQGPAPVRVAGGQRAQLDRASGAVAVVAANVQTDMAWRERRLVFESRPLSSVVSEFNLYNDTRLVLADAALNDVEVSGAFFANDPRSFVLFLQEARLARPRAGDGKGIELVLP